MWPNLHMQDTGRCLKYKKQFITLWEQMSINDNLDVALRLDIEVVGNGKRVFPSPADYNGLGRVL